MADGETHFDRPAEIKFASMNKAFFEDLVFHVTNIVKSVIDENICKIVFDCISTPYHAKCASENEDEIPYAATPGGLHGNWIALEDIPGIGDGDDMAQLLADVLQLFYLVDPWDVSQMMTDCDALLDRMDGIEADMDAYAASLAQAQTTLGAAITSLQQTSAALDRMDATATSQEQRVAALKQAMGAT